MVISDSMDGFIRSLPDDLRQRLSLHDCDRLYRLFEQELSRLRKDFEESTLDPGLAYSEIIRLGRSGAKP